MRAWKSLIEMLGMKIRLKVRLDKFREDIL